MGLAGAHDAQSCKPGVPGLCRSRGLGHNYHLELLLCSFMISLPLLPFGSLHSILLHPLYSSPTARSSPSPPAVPQPHKATLTPLPCPAHLARCCSAVTYRCKRPPCCTHASWEERPENCVSSATNHPPTGSLHLGAFAHTVVTTSSSLLCC